MYCHLRSFISKMSYSRVASQSVDTTILNQPITFRNGKKTINRIMKSPLSEKLYDWNDHDSAKRGLPNKEIINLYKNWGHGGFGIIFTGNLAVDPNYIAEAGQGILSLENTNEESLKIYKEMADVIKAEGSLAIAQINHIGRHGLTDYADSNGQVKKIAESIEDPLDFSVERIQNDILNRFKHAAKVLHECGFDGMEIHCAHGMVFNQFLVPHQTRNDKYGGSIENRTRLITDTYHAIREAVPADTGFIIGVKLNSRDFQEGGMSREDIIRVCEIIEETEFDFVELTGGAMESVIQEIKQRESTIARESYFLDFVQYTSQIFKKTVVYITGRWQTSNAIVNSIQLGLTQGVGMGRWSCAEPDFPKKLISGEVHSMPAIKFAPSEFKTAKNAAHHQMRQLTQVEYDPVKGLCNGITDFTSEDEANKFRKVCDEYSTYLKSIGGDNNHADCIKY